VRPSFTDRGTPADKDAGKCGCLRTDELFGRKRLDANERKCCNWFLKHKMKDQQEYDQDECWQCKFRRDVALKTEFCPKEKRAQRRKEAADLRP